MLLLITAYVLHSSALTPIGMQCCRHTSLEFYGLLSGIAQLMNPAIVQQIFGHQYHSSKANLKQSNKGRQKKVLSPETVICASRGCC